MREETTRHRPEAGTPVKLVAVEVLLNRMQELNKAIARRAYEFFERRGRQDGLDRDDWLKAESELLYPCTDTLSESDEAIVLRAEVPGALAPDQFQVSVEPRRLIVSGERALGARVDEERTREELAHQELLRVHNLPEEVDPSSSTATIDGQTLEVRMPKLQTTSGSGPKAKATSSRR